MFIWSTAEPDSGAAATKGFEGLFELAREAHVSEIRSLQQEVEALRGQLASTAADQARPTSIPTAPADELVPAPPFPVGAADEQAAQSHERGVRPGLGDDEGSNEQQNDSASGSEEVIKETQDDSTFQTRRSSSDSRVATLTNAVKTQVTGVMMPPKTLKRGLSHSLTSRSRLQETMRQKGMLWRIVKSPEFEMTFAALITLNALVMAAEAQYVGFTLAEWSGHESAAGNSGDPWPHAAVVFDVFGWMFGVLFCIEIVLKMFALRREFMWDSWNWIDLCIVLLWLYSRSGVELPVNAQILRLGRLARLLRIIRLVKTMKSQNFDSLYLMTTALKGSVSILTWTMVLLLVMHLLLALLLNQILREVYFREEEGAKQLAVYTYFGSFSRSLLTMFELTLANWPTVCRVLIEDVHESFLLYAVFHKMVLGFAVIGVVNGVFIQETFKVATLDDVVMVRQTRRKQQIHDAKMRLLFEEADTNGDGRVDLQEWQEVCEDDWVKVWLASQELSTHDAKSLFDLLDDGDGNLTSEELIHGVARLKGPAGSMDLKLMLARVDKALSELNAELRKQQTSGRPPSKKRPVITASPVDQAGGDQADQSRHGD